MSQPNLLIVGSIGVDTIRTPFGQVERVLGGTSVYASCAASVMCRPAVVGVVGDDFPAAYKELLQTKGVDLTCLESMPGSTFHWIGSYEGDMNVAITHDTQLGVFADFSPKIPPSHQSIPYLFLGNIHPQLQLDVLNRMAGKPIVAADSMNYWIERTPELLREVIRRVDIMLVNDGEARMLTGRTHLIDAAEMILQMGPKVVIVKKGTHGAMMFSEKEIFTVPAFPLRTAKDPTGAGDTFAGGMMGYLANRNTWSAQVLFQALVIGTVSASFTVEDFSLNRLAQVNKTDLLERVKILQKITSFGEIIL